MGSMTQLRPIFIVAVEYCGADVPERRDAPRRPVCEHAFDLRAGALAAHAGQPPRVGFPGQQRGWSTEPQASRCADCSAEVDLVVATVVAEQLRLL